MGVKTAGITNASDGATVYMWWFKARNIPKYDAPFQKVGFHDTLARHRPPHQYCVQCILAYISDSQL